MNKKSFGTIVLFSASLIWGLAFIFQSLGMNSLGPITFTAVRISLGALVIGAILVIKEGKEALRWDKKLLKSGIVCGLLTSAVILFQQIGMVNTNPGKAGFITALYIILVPVFSCVFLKDRLGAKTWIGVLIGLVGLYLLTVSGDFDLRLSDAIILICAVTFACHVLYVDWCCIGLDPLKLNFIQLAVCALLSGILALVFEDFNIVGIKSATIPIFYTGVISAGIGYLLQMIGQKYVNATLAALIMSMEAVVSVFADWIILKNVMTIRELIGCGIMFFAIILIQLPNKNLKVKENE